MTREEAIKIINQYDVNFYWTSGEHEGEKIPPEDLSEAFEMAVQALKQEPCEDAISRHEIIDYLNTEYHGMISDESMKVYKIIELLNNQPSVQPIRHKGWISVDDRLPEEYGEYLVSWTISNSKKVFMAILECEVTHSYDYEKNCFKVEWLLEDYMNAYRDVKVIAWQPLPKPYGADMQESEDINANRD